MQLPTQTGVDDVHAHPRHVGHRWLDLVLALTAVFISAVSLFVAFEHGATERALVAANAQMVEAASWPFLQINGSYSVSHATTISISNAGIGPAKLQSLQVLLDGKPVNDVLTLLERCCGVSPDRNERNRELPDGLHIDTEDHEVLRPGQINTVIYLPPTPGGVTTMDGHPTLNARYADASSRISFRACYCSVFDKCWLSNLVSLQPKPVPACPADVRSFNENTR